MLQSSQIQLCFSQISVDEIYMLKAKYTDEYELDPVIAFSSALK